MENTAEKLAEDINAKLDSFKEDVEGLKQSSKDDKVIKLETDKKIDSISDSISKNGEALKEQGKIITDLRTKSVAKDNIYPSFRKELRKALENNKDALKSFRDKGPQANVNMVLKVAGPIAIGTNVTGEIPQAERESGITRVVRRDPFISELVQSGTISSNLLSWVEQKNPDGGAGMTAEGAAKSQADFDLVAAEASVKKVTAYIKASNEILEDIPLMESEINQELVELISLKKDEQILSGDGTGDNLTGILTNATPFSVVGTPFALNVQEANRTDVLRVAINQIIVEQFRPNYILMHPSDVAMMELEKGSDGHYVMPPFSAIDATSVKGVRIVANTGITEGDFLVGDFTKSGVFTKKDLTINVGLENDDFTKNFVTILAECRLVHRVKSNNYPAFVTGDFTSAIALILKP